MCCKSNIDCNIFMLYLQPPSGKLQEQNQTLDRLFGHSRQCCEEAGGNGSSMKPLFMQHPTHTGSDSSLVLAFINIPAYKVLQQNILKSSRHILCISSQPPVKLPFSVNIRQVRQPSSCDDDDEFWLQGQIQLNYSQWQNSNWLERNYYLALGVHHIFS